MVKLISVIIPVYNEERYIARCLDSILSQTYSKEQMEILVVDGGSKDKTRDIVFTYTDKLNIKLLHNDKRLVTYGLNIGIREAVGEYLIRLDAHAEFASNYIEKCVYYLDTTTADNVGGIAETVGFSKIGKMNAEILSSKFGVGNSAFRTEETSGFVDTVPFGAFRREVFEKVGLFDPELPRSEDNDINSRIRESGGKVFLSSEIRFKYFCRETVKDLLIQGLMNGNALFFTLRRNANAMSVRHFVPFLFVASLISLPVLSFFSKLFQLILAIELALYSLLNIYYSLFYGAKKHFFYKLVMYPLFHIAYGIGSLIGIIYIKLY